MTPFVKQGEAIDKDRLRYALSFSLETGAIAWDARSCHVRRRQRFDLGVYFVQSGQAVCLADTPMRVDRRCSKSATRRQNASSGE